LWCIDLTNTKLDSLHFLLSVDEAQRADKFVFDKDRNTLLRSRVALRLILGRCLNLHPGKITFCYNEHGKPEIDFPTSTPINFNLSHSGEKAVIAVSWNRRVGIDLNHLGQTRDWPPIVKRSFSSAEQEALLQVPEAEKQTVFYRVWSQKEAYTKALGAGFTYGFQNFTVVVDTEATAGLVADDKAQSAANEWAIVPVEIGNDWVAALAYDEPSISTTQVTIQHWEFCYDK
jgi:4'-phosphopantetheinyl transferase